MSDALPHAVSIEDGTGHIWWSCQDCGTAFGPYDAIGWPQDVLDHMAGHDASAG